jgi:hypothetical protein
MNAKVKKYMKIKAALEKLAGKKVEETVEEEEEEEDIVYDSEADE